MKKLIVLLLALVMVLSLAACGGGKEETVKEPETKATEAPKATEAATEAPTEAPTEPESALTVHENTFFTVGYNEEDGWTLAEDDISVYESSGGAYVRILDEEGNTDIVVSIWAEEKDPESFRKNLYINGVDMKAYAAGEVETVDVGGQPMLYVDQDNGDRFYYGRNEAAGVTYTIDATNWEDPRVPALVENIVCTASGTDNAEPAWPWDGEPIVGGSLSQMVGTYTVTADFLPMSEPLTTFETFNHEVEVIGDKVYLLSDYVLREYGFDGAALTFSREIPLDDEYDVVEKANGAMVLSGFMNPVIGHDGDTMLYSYDGPDYFAVAPDGTWGVSWFSSGEKTEKFTFQDGALVGEPMPLSEVKTINSVDVDDKYIYVAGSPADGSDYSLFVYDHSGTLQMQLQGDPNATIGLGSITFAAKTANGFMAMDGNMRDVVLWAEDGTWLGAVEDSDLFGTYYPWFATGDVMDDGSILVVMTEDRADDSAMEAIAFKISIS